MIDSSTSVMRIGVLGSDGVLRSDENRDRYRHAEHIIPLIEKVVTEDGGGLDRLGGIVVSLGPGSFTGLRVGLATAKGLATGLRIPLAGISNFRAAGNCLGDLADRIAVLIPSRKNEYYLGFVGRKAELSEKIEIVRSEQLKDAVGNAKIYPLGFKAEDIPFTSRKLIDREKHVIGLTDFIDAASERLEAGGDDPHLLEPLYYQPFPAKAK